MEPADNPGREHILARIRSALRQSAPKHAANPVAGPIFAPIADPLERFQKECALNNTECMLTSDSGSSAAVLTSLLTSIPAGEIFVQDIPALRRMAPLWTQSRSVRWSSQGAPEESSQATITCAELLVAQTGSVFVSSGCGGRGASIVAPVHIVVASVEQLAPSLDDAFTRLRQTAAATRNSMLCLITGSSRTADIEKIIVMGAHGPRRVVVIVSTERNGMPANAK